MNLVFPSTTSHKRERIAPTLDVFARLGFEDIDLNLNHIIDCGVAPWEIGVALSRNGQRVRVVSGGWCDFFHEGAELRETVESVGRQVALTRQYGARSLRLFFGRLSRASYGPPARDVVVANIRALADEHPDIGFWFENHGGASGDPLVCREILEGVGRPNVRLTYDPINFEHEGVDCRSALREVLPLVAHVHLKGYASGEFCEFGEGDVDLTPALRTLLESGYAGAFTVEYEGRFDRTLRLYESVHRARRVVESIVLSPES